jgi:acyl-CoA thioester hydrolase
MTEPFSATFRVGWSLIDFNNHMRNTAYLELCVDTRLLFFEAHGFPAPEFERLQIGPVIFRDEVDYLHELRLMESVTVTLALAGLSEDGRRFRLRNEFFAPGGEPAGRVISTGAWFSLATRKLIVPPAVLAAAQAAAPHTDDFAVLPPRGNKA